MVGAHPPQPPGGVVALTRILQLAQPVQSLSLVERRPLHHGKAEKKEPTGGSILTFSQTPNRQVGSDESVDGVVDVGVGFSGGITAEAVVGLDVLQSFHVPGGGQLEGAVDLFKTGNQVVVHRAGAASHQAVGDHAQVVAHVPGALGLAFGSGGILVPLHLGGVGELVVDGLGGAVHQTVGLGGESFGGGEAVAGMTKATQGRQQLAVGQEARLGISSGDSFGEGGFHGKR